MRIIKLDELSQINIENIINELKNGSVECLNISILKGLYACLNNLNKNNEICISAYNETINNIIEKLNYNEDINLYYDVTLIYKSYIASILINKIRKFVYRVANTNSKNILIGYHKEKWGAIDGSLKINRKDLSIKIHKFINNIRRQYPNIVSTYTIENIGFSLTKLEEGKINDYIKDRKSYLLNYKSGYSRFSFVRKYKIKRKKSGVNLYKENLINNRKKMINFKYRNINFDNLK